VAARVHRALLFTDMKVSTGGARLLMVVFLYIVPLYILVMLVEDRIMRASIVDLGSVS